MDLAREIAERIFGDPNRIELVPVVTEDKVKRW